MKRKEVDIDLLSPMMKQYMEIKDEHEDELLFYRLGDFYELFFEDACLASRELELTLTGKNAGLSERVPMCGVPFHSVKPYIEKLVNKGYKIAICEQLEDPKSVKGMVKRGVVQVISKGTVVDLELLNASSNHYIASIIDYKYMYAICYADISIGKLYVVNVLHQMEKLMGTILNLGVLEVVLKDNSDLNLVQTLKGTYGIEVSFCDKSLDNEYTNLYEHLSDMHQIESVKMLLYYLVVKELKNLSHFEKAEVVILDDFLALDVHTVRNLELITTLRLKDRTYSLLWLLDKTKTAMGARMLKEWLMKPLLDEKLINERYDMIEVFNNEFILKEKLRDLLYNVYDIERLCGKASCGSLNARDVLQLKNSLKVLPEISDILKKVNYGVVLNTHEKLFALLDAAIYENPPVTLKEGYLIKDGYNSELDELKSIRSGGKDFIARFEEDLKKKSNISNLKVGYNKVFGYFIEVSNGQKDKVTDDLRWERRQTLTNCERYISPELKEKEALILNAEEKIIELEYSLFMDIKKEILKEVLALKDTAHILANVDALCSLATCAEEYHLVRPVLNHEHIIDIKNGFHPVISKVSNSDYVKNDCVMDNTINTLLITGPNMSGKSTYMRQLAIIIIMAQMGSFVPADEANLPIFDKIFTRIGASDDLVSGQSTFMVEMQESKNAILNATVNSLILFDELGRGTATYDGMSLAKAILEYVTKKIGCKTLFSTHYHELTSIEREISSIKNVHVSAIEENKNLIFLHKVKSGALDKSYGIHVAKLAGLPEEIIVSASKTLSYYENNSKSKKASSVQLEMEFPMEEKDSLVNERLKAIDVLRLTPLDALNVLYELKNLVDKS